MACHTVKSTRAAPQLLTLLSDASVSLDMFDAHALKSVLPYVRRRESLGAVHVVKRVDAIAPSIVPVETVAVNATGDTKVLAKPLATHTVPAVSRELTSVRQLSTKVCWR